MEAMYATSSACCMLNGLEKIGQKPSGCLQFSQRCREDQALRMLNSRQLRPSISFVRPPRLVGLELSCSYKNSQESALESEKTHTFVDEALVLKKKSQEVAPYLNGRCIYLVGMMGSGKTTVGKILSEVLGYSFFDRSPWRHPNEVVDPIPLCLPFILVCLCDKLVEQAVGGTSVAQIFKQYSETFFRDNESEVLLELSMMRRLVVATGGGAVIRPVNWKYMKKGLTVWLDVPLEALARRIAAVGTHSRPLLHHESGDAYTKAFVRLSTLSEERGEAYANADVKVSLEYIAAKMGLEDVSDLTPTAIAIEALIQIKNLLKGEGNMTYS